MNETENRCSRGCCHVSHQDKDADRKIRFDMGLCEEAENFARMVANLQDRAVNFRIEQDGRLVWLVIPNTSR